MSTENDIARLPGLVARQSRCQDAMEAFKQGGDPSSFLLDEEFAEVRQVANTAVENKLSAMLKTATAAVVEATRQ